MQAGWVLCHEPEPRVRGPEGRVSAGSPWSRCAAQREPGLSADGRAGRQRLPAAPAATLWLLPQLVSAGAGGMGCTSGYGGCPISDVSPDTQTARGMRSCGTGLAAEKHLRGALTLRMSPPSSRPTTCGGMPGHHRGPYVGRVLQSLPPRGTGQQARSTPRMGSSLAPAIQSLWERRTNTQGL